MCKGQELYYRPNNKEPVSPKKLLFGLKLYAKNPTMAPATAGTTSSILLRNSKYCSHNKEKLLRQ